MGREREGERDRERGSRAKPGIQLVYYIDKMTYFFSYNSVKSNVETSVCEMPHRALSAFPNGCKYNLS